MVHSPHFGLVSWRTYVSIRNILAIFPCFLFIGPLGKGFTSTQGWLEVHPVVGTCDKN